MKPIPIALQMFTLREESQHDFPGTLKRVADLGFDGVELAGYGGLTAKEVRNLLDNLGLQVAASHVPLDDLKNDLDKVIEEQKILGNHYVVCPYLPPDARTETDYHDLISLLNYAGEKCQSEGITLCYHNHDFELKHLADGRMALEAILDDTNSANVKAEFDIYWLAKSGENPVEWINRYQGRTPLVHLKDMTTDGEQFFAELGTGGVDIDAVLDKGDEANVKWWIIEQDESHRTPFESVKISIDYLKRQLAD
ncbi:sugar phosphate isomerase/epimerase family protein [Lentibacillus sp. Marseille-P4043]|uniref:sugar phosphate isomerase/epimerase family protein n=1 Tax=Lentibacillus sp. Marseille-P4043 TaxID=2040293 RepID=UPI000D0B2C7B|nr:sugar phosphate isomerase/epimerase [Lentibacillus sp. Marseille-P4043]